MWLLYLIETNASEKSISNVILLRLLKEIPGDFGHRGESHRKRVLPYAIF